MPWRTGNLLYVAGKGPGLRASQCPAARSGRDFTIEQAYGYARETGLNIIAVLKAELGDLDRVKRIVKVLGMVNAMPEFGHQPEVINGCSDLFVEVFGDRGRHARSAVGLGSLPRGIPVEIEVIGRGRGTRRPGAPRAAPPCHEEGHQEGGEKEKALSRHRLLPLLAALPAVLLVVQVHFTCGVVYSLDDPYIHLALARQILHGHYRQSMPASSRHPRRASLWPFLLAPFAFTRLSEFSAAGHQPRRACRGRVVAAALARDLARAMVGAGGAAALAFALNLYGLVLRSGMENSLQVTLVIIVALSLMRERLAWPFWLSIVPVAS